MKPIAAIFCALSILWILAGCDLIIPPSPPPENTRLTSDDFTWDEIDIIREYEFIGVQRIDCGMIESSFTSYGKCHPHTLAIGTVMECELDPPGKLFQFACLADEMDTSAVYLRIEFDEHAKNLDFSSSFGKCTAIMDGPAAQMPPRYSTDQGYKICIFNEKSPYSGLRGNKKMQRPAGLYLDFIDNDLEFDLIKKRSTVQVFDAPAALVLDARLLSREEREAAFQDIFKIFNFYRSFASQASLKPQQKQKEQQ